MLSVHSTAQEITFLTHSLRPFTYEENGKLKGFAIDVITELMTSQSHPITFHVYPFIRALETVEKSPNHAMFIIARRPEREASFKWVGPIISSEVYLYENRNSPTYLTVLEDTKPSYKIGVQIGNADHYFLKNNGFTQLRATDSQIQSLQMLSQGRIDLTPVSQIVIQGMSKEVSLDVSNIQRTNIKLYDSDLYIAFSKNIPDEVIQKWQYALDTIKASKKFETLRALHLDQHR